MKKISLILLLFVILSISTFTKDNKQTVEVIYFHATMRCEGCIGIEDFTTKSLNAKFGKELKNGEITLKSIDFQQTENEHFADKYKFDSQELILIKKVNGKEVKWKKLDKIWDYSSNYAKYEKYIKTELTQFMK